MIITKQRQNLKYGQVQEFKLNLQTDIESTFLDHKIYFKNANQVLQGAFFLSDQGLMGQHSDGSGGLGPEFLIGGSINPDLYYLKTTTLNNITLANGTINSNNNLISNVSNPISGTDALNLQSANSRYYLNTTTLNNIIAPSNNVSLNNNKIINLTNPTDNQDAATKYYVDQNAGISQTNADNRYYLNTTTLNNITLPNANLSINSYKITNLADATSATDALNRQTGDSRYYLNTTTLNNITLPNANLNMNTHQINNVVDPTLNQDAATKHYVDNIVPSSSLSVLKVLMLATQNTDITIGNHIKFDTIEWSRGTNITLNLSAYPNLGRFTLQAGNYILQSDFAIHTGNANDDCSFQVWNVTDNVALTQGIIHKIPISSTEKTSSIGTLNAVFTLSATKVIDIRIVQFNGSIQLICGLTENQPAWAIIQQI